MSASTRVILGTMFWLTGLATTYIYAYELEHPYYFFLFVLAIIFTEKNQKISQTKLEKWYFLIAIFLIAIGSSRAIEPVIDEMLRLLLTNVLFMIGATMLFAKRLHSLRVTTNQVPEISAHGV